jgi:glycerol-3-phosphate acyltransferase PlsX
MTQSRQRVTIAVDAMGGDYAPQEIVKGAIQATRDIVGGEIEIVLVGLESANHQEMVKYDTAGLPIRVENADEVIRDGESPVMALRQKNNASILQAMQLVKEGEADAVVSMGSTGTVLVSAIQVLGTLAGIKRPSAGAILYGLAPNTVIFDLGTNVDCRPRDLLNFATIGCIIARKIMHIENPSVAILNNGAEEGKGNKLAKDTYTLFKGSSFNFIGNIEGNDIPTGRANVIVCDGFVGNVVVKYSEGLGDVLINRVRKHLKGKLSQEEVDDVCSSLFSMTHVADITGGGIIYGVDGLVWIGHGRSKASQLVESIRQVKHAIEANVAREIKIELEKLQHQNNAQI